MLNIISSFWKHLLDKKIIFLILTLIFVIVESRYQAISPRLRTDFISFALSASGPLFGIGMPYTQFWGINPPGLLAMLSIWGLLFGTSIQSWHLLYVSCLVVISYFTGRILEKLFGFWQGIVLWIFWLVFFYGPGVQSQFFPSEINGLLFATIGFWLVLRTKPTSRHVFFATICFLFAGQVKEVFLLTPLTLLPYFLQNSPLPLQQQVRKILPALYGAVATCVVILMYLTATRSTHAYLAITQYKSDAFGIFEPEQVVTRFFVLFSFFKNRFMYLRYSLLGLFALGSGIGLLLASRKIKVATTSKKSTEFVLQASVPKHFLLYVIAACFAIGSLAGFALQGRFGNKYDMVTILPFLILISLTVKVLSSFMSQFVTFFRKKFVVAVLQMFFLLALLFPQKDVLLDVAFLFKEYSPTVHAHLLINAEKDDFLKLEHKVMRRTKSSDCVLKVYGWGSGDMYYYARRPSCTKYFLINILPQVHTSEYVQQILQNPPSAIVYTQAGADFNFREFEQSVFDFPKVLAECYEQDSEFEMLYWPSVEGEVLVKCLSTGVQF